MDFTLLRILQAIVVTCCHMLSGFILIVTMVVPVTPGVSPLNPGSHNIHNHQQRSVPGWRWHTLPHVWDATGPHVARKVELTVE